MTAPGVPSSPSAARRSCGDPEAIEESRRELVRCLLAANLRAADAAVAMLTAHGETVPQLFDAVLQPLLEDAASRVQRQAAPLAALHALQRDVVRVVSRMPSPAAFRLRADVVVVQADRQDSLLSGWLLGIALEHRGHAVADVGHVPLLQVPTFVAQRAGSPRVVVFVVDESSGEPTRLRGGVRRLRTELPGARVVLTGRGVVRDPALAHAVGADGGAATVVDGVALVDSLLRPLTVREVDTLRLVAAGRTNRQIATALGIAPSTVKSSLDRVFEKLQTPDRASAAAVAVRSGWID